MKRRNKFSLSHFKLLTGKMGYLYPIACVETLPGDTFQMATSVFLRFSPMVAPVMTPVTVKIHHWFVPYRLVWDEFEDFITGGPQGTSVPEPPYVNLYGGGGDYSGSLGDYLGLPTSLSNVTSSAYLKVSSLFHRAYALIWNEWYRDQNFQEERIINKASGADRSSVFPNWNNLMRSPWDKDYFTTASPSEQKGIAINVPITLTTDGSTPVISGSIRGTGAPVFSALDQTSTLSRDWRNISGEDPSGYTIGVNHGSFLEAGSGRDTTLSWSDPKLAVDLQWNGNAETQGGLNLNAFREAMAMQRFEEHRQLFGSRYVEYLRYLGVKASDARLQRPEYLGGGRSVIQFSEVLQTAEGTEPVGTMKGHGIGAMRTNRFRRFFEEHGVVMTLLSIRPKSIYTQGTPRKFLREIKTDYWQKELEHIGQQPVYNAEIYGNNADPRGTFGYQDRYNEYRSEWSSVHGEFRDLLNYWHLGREFESAPTLNSDFISSLPSDRIFADQTGNDTIYMMVNNSIQARRLVSKHGYPR